MVLQWCHSRILCFPRPGGVLAESLEKNLQVVYHSIKYHETSAHRWWKCPSDVCKERQEPDGVTEPWGTTGDLLVGMSPPVGLVQSWEPCAGWVVSKADSQGAGGRRPSSSLPHCPSKTDLDHSGTDYEGGWSGWMAVAKIRTNLFLCELWCLRFRCSTAYDQFPLPAGERILPERRS